MSANAIEESLLASLPLSQRLALAYAPGSARLATLALFALDTRLAGLLRHSKEPMLAQLRLAWWRESLDRDASEWPAGEPLLAALRSWDGQHKALSALVDGWEALTGHAPLPPEALGQMVEGRGAAFAALASALGRPGEAQACATIGRKWAMADLATRLRDKSETEAMRAMIAEDATRSPRVSRPLRPLLVLHGLAQTRQARGDEKAAQSPTALLKAMRLGILGF